MFYKILCCVAAIIYLSACTSYNDAPKPGSENFRAISNNAYYVQEGPYTDRKWIDATAPLTPSQRYELGSSKRQTSDMSVGIIITK